MTRSQLTAMVGMLVGVLLAHYATIMYRLLDGFNVAYLLAAAPAIIVIFLLVWVWAGDNNG